MDLAINRPKRSIKLEPDELKQLRKYLSKKTPLEASMELQVYRETLIRVSKFGSGAEKTIKTIRENLPKVG